MPQASAWMPSSPRLWRDEPRSGALILPGLTARQIFIFAGLVAALWLVAAVLLSALAPFGIYEGLAQVLLYPALVLPWPLDPIPRNGD